MSRSSDIPVIETERLRLRGPVASDLPAMIAFGLSDRTEFIGGVITEEQTREIFASTLKTWATRGYNRWNIELRDTGEVIGRCGINHPFDYPDPELGWVLFEGFEGQGYAHEAAVAALAYAESALGLEGIVSLIHPGNLRSKHLASKLGARFHEMGEIVGVTVEIWRYPEAAAC